jgi:preprotein translocase subunit YajC
MNVLLTTMGTQGTTTSASGGSMMTTFITFGLIILIFYFLIIRPQKKRDKETKNMLASMKKGDKVVSIGGIRGTVVMVKEATVVVKVDDNTRLEFSKNAIAQILDRKVDATASSKTQKSEAKKETVEAPAKKKKGSTAKSAKAEPVEDAVVVEESAADEESTTEEKETK